MATKEEYDKSMDGLMREIETENQARALLDSKTAKTVLRLLAADIGLRLALPRFPELATEIQAEYQTAATEAAIRCNVALARVTCALEAHCIPDETMYRLGLTWRFLRGIIVACEMRLGAMTATAPSSEAQQ